LCFLGLMVVRPVPDSAQMILEEDGSQVILVPAFLSAAEAAAAMEHLQIAVPWTNHPVRLFGRTLPSPRLSCWIGDPDACYRYSGQLHRPLPWMAPLQDWRQRLSRFAGVSFNSVLLNYYRDGHDRMGWHADNEPELGPDPVIASISLGCTRTFQLRTLDRRRRLAVELPSGSLLWMAGRAQHDWQHALPARRKLREARINLTWRTVFALPRHKHGAADPS
jgi:alkylated DNA repair dioxygenase AlkB